jgi:hypothetical protein
MFESPSSATTAMIEAVRQELSHFQGKQRDPAVLLRCATIDVYLAGAARGRDDAWLLKTLASKVEKLAEAMRNAKLSSPAANEVESVPRVTSVMVETLDPSFADHPVGIA